MEREEIEDKYLHVIQELQLQLWIMERGLHIFLLLDVHVSSRLAS